MTFRHSLVIAPLAAILTASAASGASPAQIHIPGKRVFPESLTSRSDGSILIGSIGARTIYQVKPGSSEAKPWITLELPAGLGIFGVLADAKSGTLWACVSGLSLPGVPPPPPSSLRAFDLHSGRPKAQYSMPTAGGFCSDIAVAQNGSVYVADANHMEIVRLKPGAHALEVWAGGGAFGPPGGLLDGISVLGDRVLANTAISNKLFSVAIRSDGTAGAVSQVELDRPLAGPDGMRSFGARDVLVVEGQEGGRLSRITLTGNTGKVTTLKQGYLDGAVAVTVVGTTAYVLEGQLLILFVDKDHAPPEHPFHASAVEVGKP